jgi:ATP-dependent RNA helicase DDX6/DHH1
MRFHGSVHVVVATPGRILDLAQKNVAKLGTCKVLVMDEVGVKEVGHTATSVL